LNRALVRLCVALAATNALAVGGLYVFVTPESYQIFREGIAMQLIRSGEHSMASLHLRRAFGVVVERCLYEIPRAAAAAAYGHCGLHGAAALAAALFVAMLSRELAGFDDGCLVAFWVAAAHLAFLGDDVGAPHAAALFDLGTFALTVALCVAVLPALAKKAAPRGRSAWHRLRAALQKQKLEAKAAACGGRVADVVAAAVGPGPSRRERVFEAVLGRQRNRRLRLGGPRSRLTELFVAVAVTAWLLDTAIGHD